MSTTDGSGVIPERQPSTTNADGFAFEINRSVQGTDLRSGFAELRARAVQARRDAFKDYYVAVFKSTSNVCETHRVRCEAFDEMIAWIDVLSGCEGCKHEEVGD